MAGEVVPFPARSKLARLLEQEAVWQEFQEEIYEAYERELALLQSDIDRPMSFDEAHDMAFANLPDRVRKYCEPLGEVE